MYRKKQLISSQEVLAKMMRYCSYQERSVLEVRTKMREFAIQKEEQEGIVEQLIKEDFINEQRFAAVYVRGKINVKRWGIYKIREGLNSKGIQSILINEAIKDIDENKYLGNLKELAGKKIGQLGAEIDSSKVYRFLLSKGYESVLIVKELQGRKLM